MDVAPSSKNHITVSASYRNETHNMQSRIIVFSLTCSQNFFANDFLQC